MSFALTSDLALTKPPRAAEEGQLHSRWAGPVWAQLPREAVGSSALLSGCLCPRLPGMQCFLSWALAAVTAAAAGSILATVSAGPRAQSLVLPSLCPALGAGARNRMGRVEMMPSYGPGLEQGCGVSRTWLGGQGVSLGTNQTSPTFLSVPLK